MNKIKYTIWQCDTSLTTLWAIMKYLNRSKNAAVKDIDIDITDILGFKNNHRQARYRPTSRAQ